MLHESRLKPKQITKPRVDKTSYAYLAELLSTCDFAKWQVNRWQGYLMLGIEYNHIRYLARYGSRIKTMSKLQFERLINSGLIKVKS